MQVIRLSILFVLTLTSTLLAQDRDKKYRLILGNKDGLTSLNDDAGALDLLRPYAYFQYTEDPVKIWVVVGGLFNQSEVQYTFHSKAGLFANLKTEFTTKGDGPRIRGTSLSAFEFDAHRYGGSTGLYYYPMTGLRLKTGYGLFYHQIYNQPAIVAFASPDSYWEHEIFANLRYGRTNPPSELYLRGFSANLYSAYSFRGSNKSWGAVGNEKKVDRFYSGSLGLMYSQPLSSWIHITTNLQGSLVSNADRLNALPSGAINQNVNKLFLRDVKSERAVVGDLGFRFHIIGNNQLALKPFFSLATYREITPIQKRNDLVAGPALTAMGQIANNHFLWDLTYGAGYGHRPDLNGLHDFKINFSYRF